MSNGRIVRVGRQRMTCHGCGQTVIVGCCAVPNIQTHDCGAAWLIEVTDDGKSRIEPLITGNIEKNPEKFGEVISKLMEKQVEVARRTFRLYARYKAVCDARDIDPVSPPEDHYAGRMQAEIARWRGRDSEVETVVET